MTPGTQALKCRGGMWGRGRAEGQETDLDTGEGGEEILKEERGW